MFEQVPCPAVQSVFEAQTFEVSHAAAPDRSRTERPTALHSSGVLQETLLSNPLRAVVTAAVAVGRGRRPAVSRGRKVLRAGAIERRRPVLTFELAVVDALAVVAGRMQARAVGAAVAVHVANRDVVDAPLTQRGGSVGGGVVDAGSLRRHVQVLFTEPAIALHGPRQRQAAVPVAVRIDRAIEVRSAGALLLRRGTAQTPRVEVICSARAFEVEVGLVRAAELAGRGSAVVDSAVPIGVHAVADPARTC